MIITNTISYRNQGVTVGVEKTGAVVFTSFPVDMTQYTDRWAELTSADFIAGIKGYSGTVYGNDTSEVERNLSSTGWDISKNTSKFTYNATTGQLTFTNPTYTKTAGDGGYSVEVKLTLNPTGRFIVWLGTVNGKKLIGSDIYPVY